MLAITRTSLIAHGLNEENMGLKGNWTTKSKKQKLTEVSQKSKFATVVADIWLLQRKYFCDRITVIAMDEEQLDCLLKLAFLNLWTKIYSYANKQTAKHKKSISVYAISVKRMLPKHWPLWYTKANSLCHKIHGIHAELTYSVPSAKHGMRCQH